MKAMKQNKEEGWKEVVVECTLSMRLEVPIDWTEDDIIGNVSRGVNFDDRGTGVSLNDWDEDYEVTM